MTAEVMNRKNERKFIPILRTRSWEKAAPSWLLGKRYINLSGSPYSNIAYYELLDTILDQRPKAPKVQKRKSKTEHVKKNSVARINNVASEFQDIKIIEVITEEVTVPRNDGTRGSALYAIPFLLSSDPPREWKDLFAINWDRPPSLTSQHRPGIVKFRRDILILDGTTIEEVNEVHNETLKLVLEKTNEGYKSWKHSQELKETAKLDFESEHRQLVDRVASQISFD